ERFDEADEVVGEIAHPEVVGRIVRTPAAGRVPGHDGERVRERVELDAPDAAIAHRAMEEQEDRTRAAPPEGNAQTRHLDVLRCSSLGIPEIHTAQRYPFVDAVPLGTTLRR